MVNEEKEKKVLLEDEDPEFEAALRRLPIIDAIPKEWDDPEDDEYWIEWQRRKRV